ncbi:hypothetical protein NKI32_16990 [Mesorhizobium sp. M0761]|uniref:hypothetical protein n=1 Tax=unclassified Mesorhizobium TaxID=325217 RepID=UPI003337653E
MGVEFLSRTKKTIRKTIDIQRVALATPHLFSAVPGEKPQVYLGTIRSGVAVAAGESFIVESRNSGSITFRRGNDTVGSMDNPSTQIVSSIQQSGGVARAVVQRVHTISGKVDVTLC